MVEHWFWLAPALPWLAALWIAFGYVAGFNRGESGERQTAFVAQAASGAAVLWVAVCAIVGIVGEWPGQAIAGEWFSSGPFEVSIAFTLDGLGLGLGLLFSLLAFFSIRFSVNYMHREDGFQRFFMVLCLFAGAMLLIVTSGNLLTAFIGWEIAGVSSFLLIGYAFDRTTATTNATRALVTNRIGDAGFLLGIFLAFAFVGGTDWKALGAPLEPFVAGLLAVGLLVAAWAKSAAVPFAPWIARALEGPTPSSAAFYGALMVHAGVLLTIRLEPLIAQSPFMMSALVVVGVLTALYGFLGALVQTDVKSSLMFSTTAQVGLMFLWCGLGWFALAAWHLAAHAAWRAYHFLSSPGHMHLVSTATRPAPHWLTRSRALYMAALRRFWLDNLADALFVRPFIHLARDARTFDEQVVNRLVGLPERASALSSLVDWDEARQGGLSIDGGIGRGKGVLGRLMEWTASLLHWFEEHLVLHGGGEALNDFKRSLAGYLFRIEQLLARPLYLILMILATLVVIL